MGNRELDVPDGNGKMRHVYPVSQTTYGQPAGIWGINCHHGPMNVFIPGFSYVRGEDVKPDQEKNERLYQLTQEQRRLEREVRYAKRDAAMYDAAGDREAASEAKLKVKQRQMELRNFAKEHNGKLVRDYNREWVNGFKNSVKSSKTIDNSVNRSIIKLGLQFFAEKDVYKQKTSSIRKAIASYNERIEEHKKKLADPKAVVSNWDYLSYQHQEGLKRHWQKEISNFEESIKNRYEELERRGELDERGSD